MNWKRNDYWSHAYITQTSILLSLNAQGGNVDIYGSNNHIIILLIFIIVLNLLDSKEERRDDQQGNAGTIV